MTARLVNRPDGIVTEFPPPCAEDPRCPDLPLAREKVLDAFEAILIEDGERAATLDATAKAAGVSKGGLLYHFGSKDELEAGLVERLDRLTTLDLERMTAADEGPVAYYVRTSVMEDDALDRVLIATTRLAQGGSIPAADMLRDTRRRWAETIRRMCATMRASTS